MTSNRRTYYPTRNDFFKRETGLETEQQQSDRVEANRLMRLVEYGASFLLPEHLFVVESLEEFKARHEIK